MECLSWGISLCYPTAGGVVFTAALGQQPMGGKDDVLLLTTKILIFQALIIPSYFFCLR